MKTDVSQRKLAEGRKAAAQTAGLSGERYHVSKIGPLLSPNFITVSRVLQLGIPRGPVLPTSEIIYESA